MRITPGTGGLKWVKTHLSKGQGESNVLRAQDADLDDPNPVCCRDCDNGPELEERVTRYYRPPTVNLSTTASFKNVQQLAYQTLPNLGFQGWPGGQISFLLRTIATTQAMATTMGIMRNKNKTKTPVGPSCAKAHAKINGAPRKTPSAIEDPRHVS